MKSTGTVRKIDELGRIVLPKELRRVYDIDEGDSLEICTDGNRIVLQKFQIRCVFCDSEDDDLLDFKGKKVCGKCIGTLFDSVELPFSGN